MIRYSHILLVTALFILFASCGNNGDQQVHLNENDLKDPLMNVNEELVRKENEQIESYIKRYQWTMEKSGTGLRYNIYTKGSGPLAKRGMTAQIRFSVSLINGTLVYDSKNDGMKSFELGKAQVESGLEEGILMMHEGDKAKLIIPSHLAFGLLGDDNKIPKRATLIYDVELVRVY